MGRTQLKFRDRARGRGRGRVAQVASGPVISSQSNTESRRPVTESVRENFYSSDVTALERDGDEEDHENEHLSLDVEELAHSLIWVSLHERLDIDPAYCKHALDTQRLDSPSPVLASQTTGYDVDDDVDRLLREDAVGIPPLGTEESNQGPTKPSVVIVNEMETWLDNLLV